MPSRARLTAPYYCHCDSHSSTSSTFTWVMSKTLLERSCSLNIPVWVCTNLTNLLKACHQSIQWKMVLGKEHHESLRIAAEVLLRGWATLEHQPFHEQCACILALLKWSVSVVLLKKILTFSKFFCMSALTVQTFEKMSPKHAVENNAWEEAP